ncbi:MAG: hypothetical protein FD147_2228 [Chloroflexi bacterium]|nr:MAG: hypothetical protein FD147_2228 [Chloroflexota bacterium]
MPKNKIVGYKTEFVQAERLSREELLGQHEAWEAQAQTNLISNATPNLMLILNECR